MDVQNWKINFTWQKALSIVLQVLTIFIPLSLFFWGGMNLNHWLVDDAGISISYAQNLANGFGLVAQPGAVPVEGFSDPAWVLLLALTAKFGIPLLTAVKVISYLFAFLIFVLLFLIFKQMKIFTFFENFIPLLWLSLQPAFVIWTASGLENSLYGMLILIFVMLVIKEETPANAILAGLIAGLISLTRPEGLVFFAIYLLFHRKQWYLFTGVFALIFGGYFIFRLNYFDAPLPNTYYIKMEGIYNLKEFLTQIYYKLRLLGNGLVGRLGFWPCAIGILGAIILAVIKKFKPVRNEIIILIFSIFALGTYLVLPNDWMGELRFATGFIVLVPLLMAFMLHRAVNYSAIRNSQVRKNILIMLTFVCIILLFSSDFIPRLRKFVDNPTVPLSDVAASSKEYKEYADILGISDFSVLQADVGGALWINQYQVVDLGGLVDPVIARSLGKDQNRFYEYILDEIQPNMIELHGKWSQRADLQQNEQFLSDYRALYTHIDPSRKFPDGREVVSGFYIRNDDIQSEADWQRLMNYWEAQQE